MKWIKVLTLLIDDYHKALSFEDLNNPNVVKLSKSHKIDNLDKNVLSMMKSHGLNTGLNYEELSEKCLSLKGIKDGLNINDPKIKSRIHYGFLSKRDKLNENTRKRWFFIISSRPLRDVEYASDDIIIEKNKLRSYLQFDVLYYYKCDNETDASPPKKELNIGESFEIARENIGKGYEISIDMGDRKYIVETAIRGERDTWFEVLLNSRKTSKEIKNSKSGRPRNMNKLQNIQNTEGFGRVREICESEKAKCIIDENM
jgi:hypothetical protein